MEVKPIKENQIRTERADAIAPARFEDGKAMLLAGLCQHYTPDTMAGIAAQWQQFAPRIDSMTDRTGTADYGAVVSRAGQPGFDYWTVLEVTDATRLPADFTTLQVPAQRYAVFTHDGPVSTLCETVNAAFHRWLPRSGLQVAGTPDFLERYGADFDPDAGVGDLEIWVPVKE